MKTNTPTHPKYKNKPTSSSLRLALENRLVFDGAVVAAVAEIPHENLAGHTDANSASVPDVPAVDMAREVPASPSQSIAPPVALSFPINPPVARPAELSPKQVGPIGSTLVANNQIEDGLSANPNLSVEATEPKQATAEQQDAADLHTPDASIASPPSELIFVDYRVQDLQTLLAGRTGEIIWLDPNRDGVSQMAEALTGRTGVDTIHILSHGEAGVLYLGDGQLDVGSISTTYAADLATIKSALAVHADILVYGCDVAAGLQGAEFISALADVTGADVAASVDPTGNANLGGDWQLETSTGSIEANTLSLADYQDLLAAPTISDTGPTRSTLEDVGLTITGITIADVDGGVQRVSLSSTTGRFSLASTTGLTGLTGNGTGTVVFNGTLTQVNAAINGMTFTPSANFNGTAAFTLSTNDGTTTVSLNRSITVSAINDAPVATDDAITSLEDGANVTGNVLANDIDPDLGDTITVIGVGKGGPVLGGYGNPIKGDYGTFTLNSDGSYHYVLDNSNPTVQALAVGQSLTESFTYTIKDTADVTSSASVIVTIDGTNDAPEVLASTKARTLTIPENATDTENQGVLVADLLANATGVLAVDVDNGSNLGVSIVSTTITNGMTGHLEYQLNGSNSWAVLAGTELTGDAKIRFVADDNANDRQESGIVTLTYYAWDGLATSSATLTSDIAVASRNDSPTLVPVALVLNETAAGFITSVQQPLLDPDNSEVQLLYKLESLPANGVLYKNGVALTVGSLFSQADVAAGTVIKYQYTGHDLSVNSSDSFTFSVRDGAGGVLGATGGAVGDTSPRTLTISVGDINAQIAINGINQTSNELVLAGEFTNLSLGMADADGDRSLMALTLDSLPDPLVGKLQYWDGLAYVDAKVGQQLTQAALDANPLRFVSTGAEPSVYPSTSFQVSASDNHPAPLAATVSKATVNITIVAANDAPTPLTTPLNILQGGSGTIGNNQFTGRDATLTATDPDSLDADRVYTISALPTQGTLFVNGVQAGVGVTFTEADLSAGLLSYSHDGYSTNADSFSFSVNDRDGGVSTGTLGIAVTTGSPTPIPPEGTLLAQAPEDGLVAISNTTLRGSDSYTLTFAPTHGTLYLDGIALVEGDGFSQSQIDAGRVVYVSDSNEAAGYHFAAPFTVKRESGLISGSSTIALKINPNNDAPTINPLVSNPDGIRLLEENIGGGDAASFDLFNVSNAVKLSTLDLQWQDSDNSIGQLVYVVDVAPAGGVLSRWNGSAWVALAVGGRFLAQDVEDGNIAYFHAPDSELRNDSISVHLEDGGVVQVGDVFIEPSVGVSESGSKTITDGVATINIAKGEVARSPTFAIAFTIDNVNDAPVANTGSFTVDEGVSSVDNSTIPDNPGRIQVLDSTILNVLDTDNTNTELVYTIVTLPSYGFLEMDADGDGSFETTIQPGQPFSFEQLSNGQLRYANGGDESLTDSFTFMATDPQSLDSNIATVNINVRPSNDPPVLLTNYLLGVNEGALDTVITNDFIGAFDPDNAPAQVQFRLVSNVAQGQLYLVNNGFITVLGVGSAFTMQDVLDGKLHYSHDGSEPDLDPASIGDSVSFVVSDSSGANEPSVKFEMHIVAVNDAPQLGGMGGTLDFVEDAPATVIDSQVFFSDADLANNNTDFNNGTLTVTLTDGLDHSADQLYISGQAGISSDDSNAIYYGGIQIGKIIGGGGGQSLAFVFNANATVANVQVLIESISFRNTDTANPVEGVRTVEFAFNDGGDVLNGGANTITASAFVNVIRANDAPVLTPISPFIGVFTEDEPNITTTVAALLNDPLSTFGLTISDVDDGAVAGIAITQLASGNGVWQYSLDGSIWHAIGGVSTSSALLLGATDFIRYIPDGKNADTASITYLAWDQTSGTAGGRADTTPIHGVVPADISAFSLDSDTATLFTTDVNDAPTGMGNLILSNTTEDTASPIGAAINTLVGLNFQDVDTGASLGGVAVIGNTANAVSQGVWQYTTEGNWRDIGTVGDNDTALVLSASTLVRFVPVADYNGSPPSLVIRALDNIYDGPFSSTSAQGFGQTRVNISSTTNGGSTAVSANTNTLGTTVTAVNDAPTISANKFITLGVIEGTMQVIADNLQGLIVVDDIEAARNEGPVGNRGQVSVTIAVPNGLSHGTVTLGATTGITITAGADNTNTVTIKGTLANVNNALVGLGFTPGVDTNLSETVTVTVNDLGNNGTGTTLPALTATQTITVTNISPSNTAPTVTVPATVSATEDTTYNFSGGVIRIADGDVRSTDIIQLTVNLSSAGTFRFSGASGLFLDDKGGIPYTLTNEPAGADVIVYGTLSNLNAALNGLSYTPTSNLNSNNLGSDYIGGAFAGHVHLVITVNDRGYGENGVQVKPLSSPPTTVDITVNAVNDAPTIVGPTGNSAYTEQNAPVVIGAGVVVTDNIDDTQLSGATVTVSSNFRTGDVLAATVTGNITASYDTNTHQLTLAGVDSIANYNQVLQSVTFSNASNNNPTSSGANTRTIAWQATDNNADAASNGRQLSNVVNSTINFTAVNDAPQLDLNGLFNLSIDVTATWNELANAPHVPVTITGSGLLVDADNLNMTQLVIVATGVADGDSEVIKIGGTNFLLGTSVSNVDVGSFLISYDSIIKTFTIVPDGASFANSTTFQSLVRGITYTNTTDNPTDGDRKFKFTITDAGDDDGAAIGNELSSFPPTATVNVNPVNDQPVITGFSPATFFENAVNATPAIIDGDITLIDIDSPNYNGGSLVVSGLIAGQDTVSIKSGAGVQVNGGNVEYDIGNGNFVVIGTYSGGNGTNFSVVFNSNATVQMVERVIENLSFANNSNDPVLQRTLTIALNDGGAGATQTTSAVVTIKTDNDAPILSASVLGGTFTEQGINPIPLISGVITLSDPDNPANFFTGGAGSITVALDSYVAGDKLTVLNQGAATGQIGVAGNVLSYGGVAFASFSGGNGSDLVITFNSSAATPAAVQALLAQLRYSSNSDNPTANNTVPERVFSITLNDGGNSKDTASTSTALTSTIRGTITIAAVNDVPIITVSGTATYTENAAATLVDAGVTLTDADDNFMFGGTVTISGNFLAGDVLAITEVSNITAGYNPDNGVLTLSGRDTVANYQQILQSLTYRNVTDDPTDNNTKTTRTLTYSLTDDNSNLVGAATGIAVKTINVTPLADAPVLTDVAAIPTYVEQQAAIIINDKIVATDADDTHLTGAIVTISAGYTLGDVLGFTNQNGITAVSNSDGVLTLTGLATLDNYTTALRSITFSSNSDQPTLNSSSRTVTWQVFDANSEDLGVASSNKLTSVINITAVNDLPVAVADSNAVNEDLTINVNATDGVILGAGADSDIDNTAASLRVNAVASGAVTSLIPGSGVGTTINGTYGHLTLNADGSYNYTADNANALAAGASASDVFSYSVLDPDGGVSNITTLTITVTGKNDNPVANPDQGAVNEDATLSVSAANGVILGVGADSDLDNAVTSLKVNAVAAGTNTPSPSAVGTTISGTYGHLTLNADGSYNYTADNANALAAGVTASDVFSYSVADPDGGVSNITTLTITVTGKNDNPVANPDLGAVNEDAALSVSAANGVILG
ncbi:MAG: Ig-like domain-containing protein, partial [Methylococcales bacterium]|nr:Ig-like domain-containing protein [Methylococcales bacterium]